MAADPEGPSTEVLRPPCSEYRLVRCLESLHGGLKKYFEGLLAYGAGLTQSQSFAKHLQRAIDSASDAISLSVRYKRGLTPAHKTISEEFMDLFHKIGGLKALEEQLVSQPSLMVGDLPAKAYYCSYWGQTVRLLLSKSRYLRLDVRLAFVAELMANSISADEEGIVLDVLDWSSPLVGACAALGIKDGTGELTNARPARLVTVRNALGDSAEGDGLRRQWLNAVAEALLEPNHGLFKLAADGVTLLPNANSFALVPDHLAQFTLLGRVMGLSLLHQEPLGKAADFNLCFLDAVFGLSSDKQKMLFSLEPELHKQIDYLARREYLNDGMNLESLGLYFSCMQEPGPDYMVPEGTHHSSKEIEFKPGGADTSVSEKNLDEYLKLLLDHHLQRWRKSVEQQLVAIKAGLAVLVSPRVENSISTVFTVEELRSALGGCPRITDSIVQDWQANSVYEGGLTDSSPLIGWFWNVVRSFSEETRSRLLAFCTGSPNPPALGFARLSGFNGSTTRFKIVGISDDQRLPTASTCFATLRLPAYKDEETLKVKMLLAMNLASGFAEAATAEA
eukprot:TRINITY_DN15445_c0_g1_i1.p1 TRINITY_DN15445_c0_g1~~TRINITY_DN15445_c0_g1_i1.p1  ORF type:complete len:587 (-),score=110.87 TRINITY_DN15445_c0_g1_i1:132-1820(-)